MSVTPLVDSSNSSSGVMSPSQVASKEDIQRQLRPRPAAIDLHDLEQVTVLQHI
jgi:hypothetical protein